MNIRVEALRHTYTGKGLEPRTVLDIPSWSLQAGEQVLLRGISGSGKTTLLNIIAGLLQPTAGQVWLGEQALYTLREAQRDRFRAQQIGYIFQTHLLVPTLTALANVEMPLVFANQLPRSQRRQRAVELLDQVGLGSFTRHRPAQLSTGQRLRIAIARALANQPALLLADEPTAALDVTARDAVMDLMQQSCRAHNAILLVASHDPALNSRFDRVVDLQNGRLASSAKSIMAA